MGRRQKARLLPAAQCQWRFAPSMFAAYSSAKSAVRAPREGVTTSTHRVASNLVTHQRIAFLCHVTPKAKLMPTAFSPCIEAERFLGRVIHWFCAANCTEIDQAAAART